MLPAKAAAASASVMSWFAVGTTATVTRRAKVWKAMCAIPGLVRVRKWPAWASQMPQEPRHAPGPALAAGWACAAPAGLP